MLTLLLIWVALLFGLILLVVDKRRRIGALTLAYFLALSLGHVPGLLAYLDADYADYLLGDAERTEIGFQLTLIGMTALIVGAMVARMLPLRTMSAKSHQPMDKDIFSRIGWRVLTIGIVAYFVLLPVSALVPSLTAVASALGTLLILGFWLQLYGAVSARNSRQTFLILATLPLLPLATLTTGGFIGFGTVWALSVAAFLFVIARGRIWFYLATPFVIFMGLSLFVTYAHQRDEIRDVVWYQNSGMMQRLDKISALVTDFQLLNLSNGEHLRALDLRLNQNWLLGLGVVRHREGEVGLLYGTTVPLWALIPRAIWPDKPAVGGGQDLVTDFTGVSFDESTSVGAGQVLEFYANFGTPGVLVGFAVLGFILMRLDQRMMRAFATANINGVIQTVLPGLALLQPLGNLLEIFVAVGAAIITSQLLIRSQLLTLLPTRRTKMVGRTMRVIGRR